MKKNWALADWLDVKGTLTDFVFLRAAMVFRSEQDREKIIYLVYIV